MDKVTRKKNLPVSGPILQGKRCTDLILKVPIAGWKYFGKEIPFFFKSVCSDAVSVDGEAVNNWKANIFEVITNYAKCDIFNADETGLFLKSFAR